MIKELNVLKNPLEMNVRLQRRQVSGQLSSRALTLDLGVMSLSPMLGIEITFKNVELMAQNGSSIQSLSIDDVERWEELR